MYAKQVIVLFIIYFAIDFTDSSIDSPSDKLKYTFIIWILFLMFTKMNLSFTICSLILFVIMYFIQNYIIYYKNIDNNIDNDISKYSSDEDSDNNKNKIILLNKLFYIMAFITILTIIIGFIVYFLDKRIEKKNNWSILKFIFGTEKCDSLK